MSKRYKWWNMRNVVPGHFKGQKGGKRVPNPGYDIGPENKGVTLKLFLRDGGFTWYKPRHAKHRRNDKRGQVKPR